MSEVTGDRPALLFLCQVLPFPPDSGVYIRSHNVLLLLAQHFQVTAVCFYRRQKHGNRDAVERAVAKLRPYAVVQAYPIPQEWSRLRLVWDHFRSVFTRRVYTHYQYDSSAALKGLTALLGRQSFSLVHMDSLDLLRYLPVVGGMAVACTHHNLESALLRRRAARERSWWRAAYIRFQAGLMELAEVQNAPRMDLNVMVSEDDARRLRALAPTAAVSVVSNGVDIEAFRPGPLEGDGEIAFVGGLNWFPNLDGLEYFVEDILPRLRARGVQASVRWIGSANEEVRRRFGASGVDLTGYVDDIRPHLRRAACFVVPLRVGGGTRLKILDAWALGKAVVSTSVGAEGLRTEDGLNILLRDDPDAFAAGVEAVLRDESLRLRLESGGRATAEAHYGWQKIGELVATAYTPLLHPAHEERTGESAAHDG